MSKHLSDSDRARIRQLAAAGVSQREIGEMLKCSHVTVGNVLRDGTPAPAAMAAAAPVDDSAALLELAAMLDTVSPEHAALCRRVAQKLATPEDESTEPEADEAEPVDHVTRCKRLHARLMRSADSAESVGNLTSAQRSYRDAADLLKTISKAEISMRDERDVVRIPRYEIEAAKLSYEAKMKVYLDRPMLCGKCNSALSACWADGGSTEDFMAGPTL